jgi:hypothetical protein
LLTLVAKLSSMPRRSGAILGSIGSLLKRVESFQGPGQKSSGKVFTGTHPERQQVYTLLVCRWNPGNCCQIAIALIENKKGEAKAQACDIACFRPLNLLQLM